MRTGSWLVVGLLLVASLSGIVQAVNPTDNDAGRPGDAGDVRAEAREISYGRHRGNVTPGVDRFDWYAFEAEEGSLLSLRFGFPEVEPFNRTSGRGEDLAADLIGPEGRQWMWLSSYNQTRMFAVPSDGTWTLRVEQTGGNWPEGYILEVERVPGASTATVSGRPGGSSLTLRAVRSIDLTVATEAAVPRNVTDPVSVHAAIETNRTYEDAAATHFYAHRSAAGRWIRVGGTGEEIPLVVREGVGGNRIAFGFTLANFTGVARLTTYTTSADAEVDVTAWTGWHICWPSVPRPCVTESDRVRGFRTRASDVDGVVTWNEASDGNTTVLAPGASVVAGVRERALDVEDHFVGFFHQWSHDGFARHPNGTTTRHADDPRFFAGPDPGRWRFRIDGPTAGAGPLAVRNYLTGVSLPDAMPPVHAFERVPYRDAAFDVEVEAGEYVVAAKRTLAEGARDPDGGLYLAGCAIVCGVPPVTPSDAVPGDLTRLHPRPELPPRSAWNGSLRFDGPADVEGGALEAPSTQRVTFPRDGTYRLRTSGMGSFLLAEPPDAAAAGDGDRAVVRDRFAGRTAKALEVGPGPLDLEVEASTDVRVEVLDGDLATVARLDPGATLSCACPTNASGPGLAYVLASTNASGPVDLAIRYDAAPDGPGGLLPGAQAAVALMAIVAGVAVARRRH